MDPYITIPHRRARGLCPVNGIRDLVQWRTNRDWSNEFLYGLAQGGGFAYLRFNSADPPRQVYWGTASPRQHRYLAELFNAQYSELENRSFKFSWKRAQEALQTSVPPILGPLDMFYLPYYQGIYHARHIPIHYVLLVGWDDIHAYVLDTELDGVQTVPLTELEAAWDVNVPGLGKRNRFVMLDIPNHIEPTPVLISRSIHDECETMLHPPVSMLGIAAMEKLSHEIANWPSELGTAKAGQSLRQVLEYLNSPPDVEGNHLTAGRDIYIAFLEQAADMASLDFSQAIHQFHLAIAVLSSLAAAIKEKNLTEASAFVAKIAEIEKKAFTKLLDCVTDPARMSYIAGSEVC